MTVYQWIEYHMCPAHTGTVVNYRMFRDCLESCGDQANASVKRHTIFTSAMRRILTLEAYTMSLQEELSDEDHD